MEMVDKCMRPCRIQVPSTKAMWALASGEASANDAGHSIVFQGNGNSQGCEGCRRRTGQILGREWDWTGGSAEERSRWRTGQGGGYDRVEDRSGWRI